MKIEHKLLLAFTTLIIIMVSGSLLSIEMSKKSLRQAIGQQQTVAAQQMLANIDREVYYRIEEIIGYGRDVLLLRTLTAANEAMAQMPEAERRAWIESHEQEWTATPAGTLTPFMASLMESNLAEEIREKKEFYTKEWLRHPIYLEMCVTNRYGVVIASTDRTGNYLLAGQPWYQQALVQPEFWLGNVRYDTGHQIYTCDIVVKIFTEEQEFAGLFRAVLNLETIEPLLKEIISRHGNQGETADDADVHVTLLTSDQHVLFSCRPDYAIHDNFSDQALLTQINRENGNGFFVAQRNGQGAADKELIAYATSAGFRNYPGLGWLLLQEFDSQTSFTPVATFTRQMWLFACLLALLALILTGFFSHSFARMVKKLAATSRELEQKIAEQQQTERDLHTRSAELHERLKELNCLYSISRLVEKGPPDIAAIMQQTANLLPDSWQYPDITCARIRIDDQQYQTDNFQETPWCLAQDIVAGDKPIGTIEVCLLEKTAAGEDASFLKEEDELLHAIAKQLGRFIEGDRARRDKEQMQAFIFQQEKLASVGQLAAGVAHEINNPVGFISSNLGTLKKYVAKFSQYIKAAGSGQSPAELQELYAKLKLDFISEDIADLINESLDGTRRVKEIVQNLKSFSRAEERTYSRANINDCLEKTLKVVWNELKYKTTVTKEYGDLSPINCYPQQLNQVFMNLLVNAAHAIDKQGTITIKTWQDDDNVHVAISDSGSGIAPEHISKLFDPFFTTKEAGKGTGLGLSIVHDIIQKHQGRIEVSSEPGHGTTFTITLPRLEQE